MGWIKIENKIDYNKNELTIGNKKIDFQYDLSDIIVTNNRIFITLQVPSSGHKLTQEEICNMFSINKFGNVEWQIQNIPPRNNSKYVCVPIVGMNLVKNDELYVTDFMGRKFQVDISTGAMTLIGAFR